MVGFLKSSHIGTCYFDFFVCVSRIMIVKPTGYEPRYEPR